MNRKRRQIAFLMILVVVILVLLLPTGSGERQVEPTAINDSLSHAELVDSRALMPKFSYLGRYASKGPAKQSKKKTAGGDVREKQGDIPELTIEAADRSLDRIAERLGYLLVAATDSVVLGKIINGQLVRMEPRELARYSLRARDADAIQNGTHLKRSIANALSISEECIRIMYLVPVSVDSRFTNLQTNAIRRAGLTMAEVKQTRARYVERNGKITIAITSIITKEGNSLAQ